MRGLFQVTTSDNIAEVLGVVSELDTVMSRLARANVAPVLSALCLLRMNEEAVRKKVGTALMSNAQAVEGTKRVFDIGGKIYIELPPRRKTDPAITEGEVLKTRKSMLKNQMSASDFKFMVTRIGGDTRTGVVFSTEKSATCLRGAFRQGADNVGEKIDIRLDAPFSIAVQAKLGLSDHQCRHRPASIAPKRKGSAISARSQRKNEKTKSNRVR